MLFNLESALTVLSQKSHEVAVAAEETKNASKRRTPVWAHSSGG